MTRPRLALAAVLLVGLASAVMIQSFSWNQTSHYDLVRALNNDQTTIDPYQANTGDKVLYKGHYYSARAPGLALFSLPFYDTLNLVGAESWTDAHVAAPEHPGDEMIYLIGLWGNVLPGLLLVALVWRVADRFEPGYGVAAAVALGLGTMVLPFSQLLFSHMFTTFLCFAAFWLMLRERDGPPSMLLLALAGLAMGYAFSSEYPTFFAAIVLGLFLLSRRDSLTALGVLRRGGAYLAGGLVGIIPLLLYNHYAFRSWTHLAYSDVPRQQKGFFGIGAPSLKVLATLLFDSRGLLTLSPILIMGAIGTVMLYKRGRRAEALTITGICACYLLYNSGYYLPFGGGFMGPRFLDTMLPFLAFPVALTLKRYPGPTIALAAVSITTTVIATTTHPLVGYENETVTWMRYLSKSALPAHDRLRLRTRARMGRHLAVLRGRGRCRRACRVGDSASAAVYGDALVGGRGARGVGPVRGARAHRARNRPRRPGEHLRGRRPHRVQPAAALGRLLPARHARPDRRRRRPAGPGRDATGAQPAA